MPNVMVLQSGRDDRDAKYTKPHQVAETCSELSGIGIKASVLCNSERAALCPSIAQATSLAKMITSQCLEFKESAECLSIL